MISKGRIRIGLSASLVALLLAGLGTLTDIGSGVGRTQVTAYFDNSNGIYPGDEIRILGVPVGEIESIEPQPQRAKITFWVDNKYQVPAEVTATGSPPSPPPAPGTCRRPRR